MFAKMYAPRNVASVAIHYAAAAALVAGSVMIGQPWAIGIGFAVSGYMSGRILRKQKSSMDDVLVRHPDEHKFSPRLGETVKELYQKSGLKQEEFPVYDYRIDSNKIDPEKTKGMSDHFNKMSVLPQASVFLSGKPVIVISEPLLKLLDDKEEKAVLAHEFAHAVARHGKIDLPTKLLGATAMTVSYLSKIVGAIAAGIPAIASSAAAYFVSKVAFLRMNNKDNILMHPKSDLTLHQVYQKQKLYKISDGVAKTAFTATLTLFSPAYLKIFLAAEGVIAANTVLMGTFSRSKEYQADRGAVKLGADPLALITAFRKLETVINRSRDAAYDGNVPKVGALTKVWTKLTVSHPSMKNRIVRLSEIARKQGASEESIAHAVKGHIDVSHDNDIPLKTFEKMVRGL